MVAEEEEGQQHQLSSLDEPAEAAHQEYSWPALRPDYGGDDGTNASSSDLDQDSFGASPVVTEGDSVYDFFWAYDAVDEIAAAFSIAFNPVGNKYYICHCFLSSPYRNAGDWFLQPDYCNLQRR
ncbi:hypothetical protein NL676_007906 [Syzygium grande]|nr:hypothetical protein NL676_007906 [Syzygium grande]